MILSPIGSVFDPLIRSPLDPVLVGGGFSPASVYPGAGQWLDPSDISTGFQDSAGTIPQTGTGEPTGKRNDRSGNGNHVLQATGGARPEYTVIGAISSDFLDRSDDHYATNAFGAGTLSADMDCFIAVNRSTADQMVCGLIGDGVAKYFGVAQGSSGLTTHQGVGTPTIFVDGNAVANTRDAMNTALGSAAWHILEMRNMDMSLWLQVRFGNYASYLFGGDMGGAILCPAQSAANRTNLRRWLGAKVGLSL